MALQHNEGTANSLHSCMTRTKGTHGVIIIIKGNGHSYRVQIEDEAVSISQSANTLEKWPSWLGLQNTLTASLQKGKTYPTI